MTAAIVQARMGSSRLPGKVMLQSAGKPLLGHLIERLGNAKTLDRIIVATSSDPQDDLIAEYCAAEGILVFRGSEQDVLDRYYQAALAHAVDLVVRITADCPLIDTRILDRMVTIVRQDGAYDLVTNRHPLTFPDGLDVDVMPIASLRHAWEHATTAWQREHTIPFFWEAGLRVRNVEHTPSLFAEYRWTLDYPEDFQLIDRILTDLYEEGQPFYMEDILEYMGQHPEVRALNACHLPQ